MIQRLVIEGFRGIEQGELEDLPPLTVFVGPNNSGKSTVLESLLLASPGASGENIKEIVERRGEIGRMSVEAMIPRGAASLRLVADSLDRKVKFTIDEEGKLVGHATPGNDPLVYSLDDSGGKGWSGRAKEGATAHLIDVGRGVANPSQLEELFSWAELAGRREWLISLLRPLLPGLKDIRILVPRKRPTVFIEDDSGRWPLTMAGDGFKRLFVLATRIAAANARFTLIEEPETFLHVGAFSQVARLIWDAMKPQTAGSNEQWPLEPHIFITTHSLEYLDAQFLNATDEQLARAALVRLSLRQGKLKAVRIEGAKVKELRTEIGEDLRR
ncbi:MAG: AAA family ATPase [Hyalangium sp.]|uniref:AAA family ATPase n=1 Tax=Hyalangium sp. TaxID=2028555 RepID=UPI00389A7B06